MKTLDLGLDGHHDEVWKSTDIPDQNCPPPGIHGDVMVNPEPGLYHGEYEFSSESSSSSSQSDDEVLEADTVQEEDKTS